MILFCNRSQTAQVFVGAILTKVTSEGQLQVRTKYLEAFGAIASQIEQNYYALLQLLMSVETKATAIDEIDKTIRGLKTYTRELEYLEGRLPYGSVCVSLPFNNPLYSLMLYCFGPLLAGNRVIARPSSITAHVVAGIIDLLPELTKSLPLEIFSGAGMDFINGSMTNRDVSALIFAGNWRNVERLLPDFPHSKKLVYCGSGINPFVVDSDAAEQVGLETVAKMIVESRIYNSGQDCLCSERIFVHHDIHAELLDCLEGHISRIVVGNFGDDSCDVCPLLGGVADSVEAIAQNSKQARWLIPFRREGNLVHPSLAVTSLDDALLNAEKFAPIFTLASFKDYTELDRALDSNYMFGATVCGSYGSDILSEYPHVTRSETVIANEAEDAHVPFGGKRRSGFVKLGQEKFDGPILYSIETSSFERG